MKTPEGKVPIRIQPRPPEQTTHYFHWGDDECNRYYQQLPYIPYKLRQRKKRIINPRKRV